MVKICSHGSEWMVLTDGLTRGQAERIANVSRELLKDDYIGSGHKSENGLGSNNIMPCGPYKGLTVDDIFIQYEFEGVLRLLRCIPQVAKSIGCECDRMFCSMPYPYMIRIYNEILLYASFVVLRSPIQEFPLSLRDFLDLFGDFLADCVKDSGYDTVSSIHPNNMTSEKQLELLNDLTSSLRFRWVNILLQSVSPEEQIFYTDLKITEGIYSGTMISDAFFADRNRALTNLLCTTKKMQDGEKLYRATVLFTATLLRYREYLPFREFLTAYSVFLPGVDASALLELPSEAQDAEYEKLSHELGKRMLDSIDPPQNDQAA